MHDILSSARHYGSRETEQSLLQGLPHTLQIKDFHQPERALNLSNTKEPDLSKQVLRPLSGHRSYCQSGRILAVLPPLVCVFTGQNLAVSLGSFSTSEMFPSLLRVLFLHFEINKCNTNPPGVVIVLNMIMFGLQNRAYPCMCMFMTPHLCCLSSYLTLFFVMIILFSLFGTWPDFFSGSYYCQLLDACIYLFISVCQFVHLSLYLM